MRPPPPQAGALAAAAGGAADAGAPLAALALWSLVTGLMEAAALGGYGARWHRPTDEGSEVELRAAGEEAEDAGSRLLGDSAAEGAEEEAEAPQPLRRRSRSITYAGGGAPLAPLAAAPEGGAESVEA